MTVGIVNNLNFKGTSYSKNGNEYKKTYIGRIIGTGAGIGLAVAGFRVKDGVGKFGTLTQKYKGMINRAIDNIAKENPAMEEALKKIVTEGKNILNSTKLKTVVKYATPIAAAWFVVGGYLKGAIVDKVINNKRAAKADEANLL